MNASQRNKAIAWSVADQELNSAIGYGGEIQRMLRRGDISARTRNFTYQMQQHMKRAVAALNKVTKGW